MLMLMICRMPNEKITQGALLVEVPDQSALLINCLLKSIYFSHTTFYAPHGTFCSAKRNQAQSRGVIGGYSFEPDRESLLANNHNHNARKV